MQGRSSGDDRYSNKWQLIRIGFLQVDKNRQCFLTSREERKQHLFPKIYGNCRCSPDRFCRDCDLKISNSLSVVVSLSGGFMFLIGQTECQRANDIY